MYNERNASQEFGVALSLRQGEGYQLLKTVYIYNPIRKLVKNINFSKLKLPKANLCSMTPTYPDSHKQIQIGHSCY